MEKLFFRNKAGRALCGILDSVDDDKVVILCHGSNSSKESATYVNFAKRINDEGISTFRFDFSGHGESEGARSDYSIPNAVEEILLVIDLLKAKGFTKFGLLGSSKGGTSALRAALRSSILRCLVVICPGSRSEEDYAERNDLCNGLKIPLLIIHGDKDPFVPILESRKLIEKVQNGRLEVMVDGGHNFTEPKEHNKMLDLGTSFIQQYL